MNNSPFPITPLQDNKFMLSWPKWQNIKHFDTKKRLLKWVKADRNIDIENCQVTVAICPTE